MTHIATNMDIIKDNALLHIETYLQQDLHLLQSIILIFSLGLHTPQGWLTRGNTLLVLMDSTRNSSLDPPSGTHPGFLLIVKQVRAHHIQ